MLSNKELDIIGEAYQNAYEERLELIKFDGQDDLDAIKIADTWIWFDLPKLEKPIPNKDTFKLMHCLAKDIDKLDDLILFADLNSSEETLLKMMRDVPKLHKKIDLQSFASHIRRCNGDKRIVNTLKNVLNFRVQLLEHIIKEINSDGDDYISKKDWVHYPTSAFGTSTEVYLRR